jgi:hypothetical protein
MLTGSLALAVFCLTTQRPAPQSADVASPPAQDRPVEPAAAGEGVVQMLKDGKARFELLDTDGGRHKASLVRIDGDNVVLRSRHELFIVPADQMQRSNRRGDRPWDGALVGLSVGLGVWALIAEGDPGGGLDWKADNPDDWTVKDTVSLLAFSTTVGYIIDALHVGKHTVFVGPMRASTTKPKPGLTLNFAGPPRERQLQVGYRVTF